MYSPSRKFKWSTAANIEDTLNIGDKYHHRVMAGTFIYLCKVQMELET